MMKIVKYLLISQKESLKITDQFSREFMMKIY
jgi:hypothetical protein